MTEKLETLRHDADDAPGCAAFESTLALIDGEVSGDAAALARSHAAACAICGPLVASWSATHAAFVATFEDAAERAKPDLADLATRVLDRVRTPAQKPKRSLFSRLWKPLGAPLALAAAAAAVLLVVLPRVNGPTDDDATDEAEPSVAQVQPPADPNDVHMHSLAFDGADGMVFRTTQGHMTVIWVSEKPKA